MSDYRMGLYRDVRVYNLKEDSPKEKLSNHFVLGEFSCGDGSPLVLVHPGLPLLLEAIRLGLTQNYGTDVSISINSGFRSVSHNIKIGGEDNSRHMFGFAADIIAFYREDGHKKTIPNDVVADVASLLNPGGLGRYNNFTHVDVSGINRRWDERKK